MSNEKAEDNEPIPRARLVHGAQTRDRAATLAASQTSSWKTTAGYAVRSASRSTPHSEPGLQRNAASTQRDGSASRRPSSCRPAERGDKKRIRWMRARSRRSMPTRRTLDAAQTSVNKTGFSSLREKTHTTTYPPRKPLPHLNIRRAPVRQLPHEVVADGRQPHREFDQPCSSSPSTKAISSYP